MSQAGPTEPSHVPPELRKRFWLLVALFNLALLALAVGVLLVAFGGRVTVGAALAAAGVVGLGFGWYRYRLARDRPLDVE